AMSASHQAYRHARLERLLDHPNLLRRCPAPTALNRCDDLNSIRSVGHRHGCMPHTCQVGDRVRSVRGLSQTIQTVINSAAAQNGNRPVVHIPEGTYHITSTITIPAGTDIQLVGDGNTQLIWAGTGSGPLLYIPGPTKATLRDLQFDGGYRPYDQRFAAGIVADNIDQPGSVVYLDQVLTAGGVRTNFLVNGLDYTDIEAHDFSHLLQQNLPGSVGGKVIGGPPA